MISRTAITITLTSVQTGTHQGPIAVCTGARKSISNVPPTLAAAPLRCPRWGRYSHLGTARRYSCPLDGHGAGQAVEAAGRRMRGGDAHDTGGHRCIDLRRENRFAASLTNLDLRALLDAELVEERPVEPRLRRLRVC